MDNDTGTKTQEQLAGTQVDPELYGELPRSNEMYPIETTMRPTFRARADDVAVGLGLSQAQVQARHREFVDAIRESGLDPYTVGASLYDEYTNAQLGAARGTAGNVEENERAWQEDTRRALRSAYGPARAETLRTEAQAFVRSHPKLERVLQTGGIGSKAAIATQIVDHVRKRSFK